MKNIIKIFFMFGIFLFAAFSCEDEDNPLSVCGIEEPQENIAWLKEIIEKRTNAELLEGIKAEIYCINYNGDYIIEVILCVDCADGIITYYDCEGNVFCQAGGIAGVISCPEDLNVNYDNKKIMWKNY